MEVQECHGVVEQMAFDGLAVGHQGIGGAVEAHGAHSGEVHAQQLAQGAALAQPVPGGAFRARSCHARDDRAGGGGAHRRAHTELVEQRAQSEPVHGPQGDVLDADRARSNEFQGVDVDVLEVRSPARRRVGGADALKGEELCGDTLSVGFEHRRAIGRQWELPDDQFVDASAQKGPMVWVDLEVSSQVEQGTLSHLGALAFGAHESEGVIMLATAAGTCASDEHGGKDSGVRRAVQSHISFYGTTLQSPTTHQ